MTLSFADAAVGVGFHPARVGRPCLASRIAGGGAKALRSHLRPVRPTAVEHMSDLELVSQLGDDACLREFIARHTGSVRCLASSMMRSSHDADEVVQDTFIAAHRSYSQFRGESSPRTWLHTICYRRCLTLLRKKRLQLVSDDVVAGLPAGPADEALRMTLDRAIAGLTGDLKVAFTLVDVLGFSREEAAQMARVPGNTMRARAARARVVLASMLTEGDES